MFISQAFAQEATNTATDVASSTGGALPPGVLAQLAPLLLIFVVFYFLLIRPQQKKLKAHLDMVAALRRGDKVVTGGGIVGTISRVIDDKEIMVEIAEGIEIKVIRSAVSEVISKNPVGTAPGKDKAA